MLALTPEQIEAVRALCSAYQVTRLELFGSAAREDFDPERSDIDLLIEFAPGVDLGPWMGRFFDCGIGWPPCSSARSTLSWPAACATPT